MAAKRAPRVLLAGESWVMHVIHQKGFDSFTTTDYGEGHQFLSAALRAGGMTVTHLPNHLVASQFPQTAAELDAYDVVILSDCGCNNLLLHPDTFVRSKVMPNRTEVLRDWVAAGGGLVMVGGYLTFSGIDGKAGYGDTAVEEALPVIMLSGDDRKEVPEGTKARILQAKHPILDGVPRNWPALLGYNRLIAKEDEQVIVANGDDPLIVAGEFGKGRGVAYASDCGPHWSPPAFCAWKGYAPLWQNMVKWAAGA